MSLQWPVEFNPEIKCYSDLPQNPVERFSEVTQTSEIHLPNGGDLIQKSVESEQNSLPCYTSLANFSERSPRNAAGKQNTDVGIEPYSLVRKENKYKNNPEPDGQDWNHEPQPLLYTTQKEVELLYTSPPPQVPEFVPLPTVFTTFPMIPNLIGPSVPPRKQLSFVAHTNSPAANSYAAGGPVSTLSAASFAFQEQELDSTASTVEASFPRHTQTEISVSSPKLSDNLGIENAFGHHGATLQNVCVNHELSFLESTESLSLNSAGLEPTVVRQLCGEMPSRCRFSSGEKNPSQFFSDLWNVEAQPPVLPGEANMGMLTLPTTSAQARTVKLPTNRRTDFLKKRKRKSSESHLPKKHQLVDCPGMCDVNGCAPLQNRVPEKTTCSPEDYAPATKIGHLHRKGGLARTISPSRPSNSSTKLRGEDVNLSLKRGIAITSKRRDSGKENINPVDKMLTEANSKSRKLHSKSQSGRKTRLEDLPRAAAKSNERYKYIIRDLTRNLGKQTEAVDKIQRKPERSGTRKPKETDSSKNIIKKSHITPSKKRDTSSDNLITSSDSGKQLKPEKITVFCDSEKGTSKHSSYSRNYIVTGGGLKSEKGKPTHSSTNRDTTNRTRKKSKNVFNDASSSEKHVWQVYPLNLSTSKSKTDIIRLDQSENGKPTHSSTNRDTTRTRKKSKTCSSKKHLSQAYPCSLSSSKSETDMLRLEQSPVISSKSKRKLVLDFKRELVTSGYTSFISNATGGDRHTESKTVSVTCSSFPDRPKRTEVEKSTSSTNSWKSEDSDDASKNCALRQPLSGYQYFQTVNKLGSCKSDNDKNSLSFPIKTAIRSVASNEKQTKSVCLKKEHENELSTEMFSTYNNESTPVKTEIKEEGSTKQDINETERDSVSIPKITEQNQFHVYEGNSGETNQDTRKLITTDQVPEIAHTDLSIPSYYTSDVYWYWYFHYYQGTLHPPAYQTFSTQNECNLTNFTSDQEQCNIQVADSAQGIYKEAVKHYETVNRENTRCHLNDSAPEKVPNDWTIPAYYTKVGNLPGETTHALSQFCPKSSEYLSSSSWAPSFSTSICTEAVKHFECSSTVEAIPSVCPEVLANSLKSSDDNLLKEPFLCQKDSTEDEQLLSKEIGTCGTHDIVNCYFTRCENSQKEYDDYQSVSTTDKTILENVSEETVSKKSEDCQVQANRFENSTTTNSTGDKRRYLFDKERLSIDLPQYYFNRYTTSDERLVRGHSFNSSLHDPRRCLLCHYMRNRQARKSLKVRLSSDDAQYYSTKNTRKAIRWLDKLMREFEHSRGIVNDLTKTNEPTQQDLCLSDRVAPGDVNNGTETEPNEKYSESRNEKLLPESSQGPDFASVNSVTPANDPIKVDSDHSAKEIEVEKGTVALDVNIISANLSELLEKCLCSDTKAMFEKILDSLISDCMDKNTSTDMESIKSVDLYKSDPVVSFDIDSEEMQKPIDDSLKSSHKEERNKDICAGGLAENPSFTNVLETSNQNSFEEIKKKQVECDEIVNPQTVLTEISYPPAVSTDNCTSKMLNENPNQANVVLIAHEKSEASCITKQSSYNSDSFVHEKSSKILPNSEILREFTNSPLKVTEMCTASSSVTNDSRHYFEASLINEEQYSLKNRALKDSLLAIYPPAGLNIRSSTEPNCRPAQKTFIENSESTSALKELSSDNLPFKLEIRNDFSNIPSAGVIVDGLSSQQNTGALEVPDVSFNVAETFNRTAAVSPTSDQDVKVYDKSQAESIQSTEREQRSQDNGSCVLEDVHIDRSAETEEPPKNLVSICSESTSKVDDVAEGWLVLDEIRIPDKCKTEEPETDEHSSETEEKHSFQNHTLKDSLLVVFPPAEGLNIRSSTESNCRSAEKTCNSSTESTSSPEDHSSSNLVFKLENRNGSPHIPNAGDIIIDRLSSQQSMEISEVSGNLAETFDQTVAVSPTPNQDVKVYGESQAEAIQSTEREKHSQDNGTYILEDVHIDRSAETEEPSKNLVSICSATTSEVDDEGEGWSVLDEIRIPDNKCKTEEPETDEHSSETEEQYSLQNRALKDSLIAVYPPAEGLNIRSSTEPTCRSSEKTCIASTELTSRPKDNSSDNLSGQQGTHALEIPEVSFNLVETFDQTAAISPTSDQDVNVYSKGESDAIQSTEREQCSQDNETRYILEDVHIDERSRSAEPEVSPEKLVGICSGTTLKVEDEIEGWSVLDEIRIPDNKCETEEPETDEHSSVCEAEEPETNEHSSVCEAEEPETNEHSSVCEAEEPETNEHSSVCETEEQETDEHSKDSNLTCPTNLLALITHCRNNTNVIELQSENPKPSELHLNLQTTDAESKCSTELQYSPTEEKDITHPAWEAVKNLTTDLARYESVRKIWGSTSAPNPNRNLTVQNFRRRRMLEQLSDKPVTETGRNLKRKAEGPALLSQPPKKRHRTVPSTVLQEMELAENEKKYYFELLEMRHNSFLELKRAYENYDNQIQVLQNSAVSSIKNDVLYDTFTAIKVSLIASRNKAERQLRLAIFEIKKKFRSAYENLNTLYRTNQNNVSSCLEEISKYDMFYLGLQENGEDTTMISENQRDSLLFLNDLLNDFYKLYS